MAKDNSFYGKGLIYDRTKFHVAGVFSHIPETATIQTFWNYIIGSIPTVIKEGLLLSCNDITTDQRGITLHAMAINERLT